MCAYARIILVNAVGRLDMPFTYRVPEGMAGVAAGKRVAVPFGRGNATREGYVVGFSDSLDGAEAGLDPARVKDIARVIDDAPLFDENMLRLAYFMRDKYYTTLAACLNCMIPAGLTSGPKAFGPRKDLGLKARFARLNGENAEIDAAVNEILARGGPQGRVVRLLADNGGMMLLDLMALAGVSASPVKTLEKNGVVVLYEAEVMRGAMDYAVIGRDAPPELMAAQQNAVDFILNRADNSKPVLIHGVTGSGKTEVYTRLIAAAVKDGKQAIVLVPEISLTPQTVGRFAARFGERVSMTHSRMSLGERYDQWRKAQSGAIDVMIGPRSAVFAPFKRLGVIIVDEEHENTYKSETSPKYSALEVAIERGAIERCAVIMGSATPSVDSYFKARNGLFDLVRMPERVNRAPPAVSVIDMRDEFQNGNRSPLSFPLINAMAARFERGEQVILFLNRRGHSTFVSCRRCGAVMMCANCNVNYTYHAYDNKLVCHYCGKRADPPALCPDCGSKHIRYFGAGTQKIEEETRRFFPGITALRMDTDTTAGKNAHEKLLEQFRQRQADVLIGTQMIAKGLDFPNVTLVGVIAADLSLNNGDFRAGETAFQLLTQVSGRAGRADKTGQVLIQTYNPGHYSVVYARDGDYESFFEHEIALRRQMSYPPYTHIFHVMFSGERERDIITALHRLADIMRFYNRDGSFELLGPSPAVISKLRGLYRWKIMVKCADETRLKNYTLYCVDKLRQADALSGITTNLTLDPALLL